MCTHKLWLDADTVLDVDTMIVRSTTSRASMKAYAGNTRGACEPKRPKIGVYDARSYSMPRTHMTQECVPVEL